MNLLLRLCFLFGLVALVACARPVLPDGGPKDTTPPQLIVEKSTPNEQVHFEKKDLAFTFNEFITLDKADQQVLISPPLTMRPKISVKDKSVLFRFDEKEELRPNTTYIINFGSSIKDYTEGNIVHDFQYVFSTGDNIDSLQLSANIKDAETGKPADNTVLMLYRDLSDSVVYKILPDYAGRTDKDGSVTLRYMQPGLYQAVALKDENFNYKYDLTKEKAGFLRDTILLPHHGKPLDMQIFGRDQPVRVTAVDSASNQRIRFIFEPSTAGIKLYSLMEEPNNKIITGLKYIDVYYGDTTRSINAILMRPGFEADTIRHKLSGKVAARKPKVSQESADIKAPPHVPGEPVRIRFNVLLAAVDTSTMTLMTLKSKQAVPYLATIDPSDNNYMLLLCNWMTDSTYLLNLQQGAIRDVLGNVNDSLEIQFKITDPSTLSALNIRIDSLQQDFDYIIRLAKGNDIIRQWTISGKDSFKAEVLNLPAEAYDIHIMEDINKNGRIDKGNFDKKEDPEKIYTRKLEQLRQNWTVDIEVNMNDFKNIR